MADDFFSHKTAVVASGLELIVTPNPRGSPVSIQRSGIMVSGPKWSCGPFSSEDWSETGYVVQVAQ